MSASLWKLNKPDLLKVLAAVTRSENGTYQDYQRAAMSCGLWHKEFGPRGWNVVTNVLTVAINDLESTDGEEEE